MVKLGIVVLVVVLRWWLSWLVGRFLFLFVCSSGSSLVCMVVMVFWLDGLVGWLVLVVISSCMRGFRLWVKRCSCFGLYCFVLLCGLFMMLLVIMVLMFSFLVCVLCVYCVVFRRFCFFLGMVMKMRVVLNWCWVIM